MESTTTPTMRVDTAVSGAVKNGRFRASKASSANRVAAWRKVILGAAGVVLVGLMWEAYKFLGPERGFTIGDITILPRTNDLSMPHIATMFERLGEPLTGASN